MGKGGRGVLQIVTKMYFREGVPLYSTVHRQVLYTNCSFLRETLVRLPVGEFAPSTGIESVSTVTVSVTEHLEAEDPDGERSNHISTDGERLVGQLADVLSFGLNAVFSRDRDLVRRLVPNSRDALVPSSASKLFRGTFDPARFVPDAELDRLRQFIGQLLALRRDNFEAALRAIRRIVHATQRAVIDPTIAYVDLVAALESLSEGANAPTPAWHQMDDRKRALFDEAVDGTDPELAERVRRAAMNAERLGSASRFVAFVMDNISPSYFRAEAGGVIRPIRGADLERALKSAYGIRSRNVHALETLPPEAWILGEPADTVSPPGLGTMLSLEGLARLARHVVRNYIGGAPTGTDHTFDWRASLPGRIQMQLAPQYWIWNADGFGRDSAERYFSGLVGNLIDAFSGESDGVADMDAVLERIEELLPGTADGDVKQVMIATYALWHGTTATENHRPGAADLLSDHEDLLKRPSIASFTVGLLSNRSPDWNADQWSDLARQRRAERFKRSHLELAPSVDAALQVIAAGELAEAGLLDEARALARFAIEELPGNGDLVAWEAKLLAGEEAYIDIGRVVFGADRDEPPAESATGPDHVPGSDESDESSAP